MISDVQNRMLELTQHHRRDVQIAAILALGEGAGTVSVVIDRLMVLTEDPADDVKIAAIQALGRIYRRRKIPT
ncbi:HEAT repeat domain-containing protein [Yersinia bercovieri]|uniref:HEAT repeat domain-containing protein n=1 Tax=Yersinia bercovieri TaxID=634 RepID=UPI0011A843D6|nr:HEAT repeat domain-containing protein [Yersinia bercovieri]